MVIEAKEGTGPRREIDVVSRFPFMPTVHPKPKQISLAEAYEILGKKILLKKSSSNTKKCRKELLVNRLDGHANTAWLVTGGRCAHTVTLVAESSTQYAFTGEGKFTLVCQNHEPEHKAKKDGWACSHVSAVQLMLAKEIMNNESIPISRR